MQKECLKIEKSTKCKKKIKNRKSTEVQIGTQCSLYTNSDKIDHGWQNY